MRWFVPLAALLLASLAPATAHANGNNSHLWITLQARDGLPDGELKKLLERPDLQVALGNGAAFPDGGYVLKDDYGEMAHWEPFVIAYMDWIRAHYRKPYAADPEAAAHVAFLLGIASHGMGDQVYDSLFMDVARVRDAAGWSDELLSDFDTATDVLFVAGSGWDVQVAPWAPSYELSDLYLQAFGYDVGPTTIDTAQRLLAGVRAYPQEAAQDASKVAGYRTQYAWAGANMMDGHVPGGPPCEAAVVTAYLQAIWDRLNGEASLENLVIATSPAPGASVQTIDHTLVEAQIGVVFGHAIDDASLGADTVTVSDATGQRIDVELSMWRSQSNVLRLRPRVDWPADQVLTVTLHPGLRTIDGMVLDAPWSFEVSTAAARPDAPLPGTVDPTPNTSEPDLGKLPESGGCSASGRHPGGGAAGLAVLLLLAASFTRRMRTITRVHRTPRRAP